MYTFCSSGTDRTKVATCAVFLALALLIAAAVPGQSMSGVAPVKKSTWFVDKSEYAVSAHGSFSCEECHSTLLEDDQEHPDPTDQAFLKKEPARSYDYSQCRRCHPDNYARYGTGVHAEALKKDLLTEETPSAPAMPAPTCGSCHSSHYAKAKLSRVESGMFMVETCGTCHPEETRSYLKNYHGKTAVYHKMEDSALCTDCHGAHRCVSLQENTQALAACRRCHPEATDEFAEYVIHATTAGLSEEEEDKRAKVELIHLIEIIGVIFVVAVLGFFYFHTIIWFLRRMHEKLRKR